MKSTLAAVAIAVIVTCSKGSHAQDFVRPDAAAPDFRASVVEKRDEHTIVECDKRTDEAKVRRQDRFSFFQQCLIGEPKTLR
jgi:hypothetical protein